MVVYNKSIIFKNKKMIIITIIKSLLSVISTVGILGSVVISLATIVTLLIGVISKDYKYFKISLKALGWVVVTLFGSVLLYAIMLFLEKVLVG